MSTEPEVPANRAPTLTDVAKLAGVSVATASKAINGRDEVKAATRERVLKAAELLSFEPNALARGLLRGRTGTVGLLTSDLEGRFSIPILMGAEDASGAVRARLFVGSARAYSHVRGELAEWFGVPIEQVPLRRAELRLPARGLGPPPLIDARGAPWCRRPTRLLGPSRAHTRARTQANVTEGQREESP